MQLQRISADGTAQPAGTLTANSQLTIVEQNAAYISEAITASSEAFAVVLGEDLDAETISDATLSAFVKDGVVLKTNLATR